MRGKPLDLLTSFLDKRKFYTEVQGYRSEMREMPRMSVIQGTRLSGLFYQLYTIDNTKIAKIMIDKDLYFKLTKKR